MATLGLVNIGALATGVLAAPRAEVEAILVRDGRVAAIGAASRVGAAGADVVVDCQGTTVIPGLIDSHCHVVLGDYTPRQKTVDFLDSYVHGGITSVVSAGEGVHAPGRPHDPVAAKAIAIAAAKCFEHFHPNGMKVVAGSVVLEPGLTDDDFAEMARHGVRHAKYGFGGYAQPRDGEPEVRRAQKHGLCVQSHSGGTSIPGSSPISHEVLLHLRPDVCGHVNGGTTSLDEVGIDRIIAETGMALQVVQAGNLRSALYIVKRAREAGAPTASVPAPPARRKARALLPVAKAMTISGARSPSDASSHTLFMTPIGMTPVPVGVSLATHTRASAPASRARFTM